MGLIDTFFKKNVVDEYFKLRNEIYDYFRYPPDWSLFPITDETAFYWAIDPDFGGVRFGLKMPGEDWRSDPDGEWEYHFEPAYTLTNEQWVYRAQGFTLLVCDTKSYGNKVLAIFDNAKEVTEDK